MSAFGDEDCSEGPVLTIRGSKEVEERVILDSLAHKSCLTTARPCSRTIPAILITNYSTVAAFCNQIRMNFRNFRFVFRKSDVHRTSKTGLPWSNVAVSLYSMGVLCGNGTLQRELHDEPLVEPKPVQYLCVFASF